MFCLIHANKSEILCIQPFSRIVAAQVLSPNYRLHRLPGSVLRQGEYWKIKSQCRSTRSKRMNWKDRLRRNSSFFYLIEEADWWRCWFWLSNVSHDSATLGWNLQTPEPTVWIFFFPDFIRRGKYTAVSVLSPLLPFKRCTLSVKWFLRLVQQVVCCHCIRLSAV